MINYSIGCSKTENSIKLTIGFKDKAGEIHIFRMNQESEPAVFAKGLSKLVADEQISPQAAIALFEEVYNVMTDGITIL